MNDDGTGVACIEGSDALDVTSLGKGRIENHRCRYTEQIGAIAGATSERRCWEINDVDMSVSRRRAAGIRDEAENSIGPLVVVDSRSNRIRIRADPDNLRTVEVLLIITDM
jgi:hypothetical protein